MKLTDLNPRWVAAENRHGMGIAFSCPHCKEIRLAVFFANPIDGGAAWTGKAHLAETHGLEDHHVGVILWQRTGETFETISLTPSIDTSHFGHWHGYVTNGEIT